MQRSGMAKYHAASFGMREIPMKKCAFRDSIDGYLKNTDGDSQKGIVSSRSEKFKQSENPVKSLDKKKKAMKTIGFHRFLWIWENLDRRPLECHSLLLTQQLG